MQIAGGIAFAANLSLSSGTIADRNGDSIPDILVSFDLSTIASKIQSGIISGAINPTQPIPVSISSVKRILGNASINILAMNPVIQMGSSNPTYTNLAQFSTPIQVFDILPTTTTISQGKTVLQTFSGASATFAATLKTSSTAFTIKSIDSVGHTTTVTHTIDLDQTPPVIILGANDNQITSKPAFSLPIQVTSQAPKVTTVLQNGQQIATNSTASFTVSATLAEGVNVFQVNSLDSAGNSATVSLSHIVLNNIPPTITLGQNDNQFVNNPVFSLLIQIADASSATTTIFLNGTQISSSSKHNCCSVCRRSRKYGNTGETFKYCAQYCRACNYAWAS